MPNGRSRQHNTAYANRRRIIEREQVVQASMVNPIVIQQAQQVIVEAQIDNSEDLQRQIEELKAKIINKENNIKRIKKELNNQKKKFEDVSTTTCKFINQLKELDILEEGENSKKDGLIIKEMAVVPTKMNFVEKDQEDVATTTNRKTLQKYILFLETVIVASNNGKNIIDLVGGYVGFEKNLKSKKLLQALIMKSADKECGEGTSEKIEKSIQEDQKNGFKNLRKYMTGKEDGKLVYDN